MVPATKRRRRGVKIEFEENSSSSCTVSRHDANGLMAKDCCSTGTEPAWKRHLENIRQMRSGRDAPVDSMGCHMLADKLADPKVSALFLGFSIRF
ncbi:unnamed protein product [Gongylonema pulchrum]|uniref:Uncharacterized protein n=1 Tax=Gongylonema pulchrum TaxID=637853 RepID=A0A183D7V8_9BILA|nr:unnamed protein product [Gongylonema pulchrum]